MIDVPVRHAPMNQQRYIKIGFVFVISLSLAAVLWLGPWFFHLCYDFLSSSTD
jgi:hypothetical protein